jgi:hypothetical protein
LVIRTLTLLIEGVNLVRETTNETELLAFIDCERSAFVPVRIRENSVASKGDTKGPSRVTGGHGKTTSNIVRYHDLDIRLHHPDARCPARHPTPPVPDLGHATRPTTGTGTEKTL